MRAKPTDVAVGIDIDYDQITADLSKFALCSPSLPLCARLKLFITSKQSSLTSALTPARLAGFEHFPRYTQLLDMATHGLRPFCHPSFVPNRGQGDFLRSAQHHRLRHTIAQHLRKLQDNHRCFVIPFTQIVGTDGFHLSALHIASKAADSKGRACTDATHSGLNDGTDMLAITAYLGDFQLPQLRSLAQLLVTAQRVGDTLLHKTDVTAAFNTMLLSPEAALLQTFRVGPWVIIPLVAGFGWCASPAYYNVIASAITWAHNGGLSTHQLDTWTRCQGRLPSTRNSMITDRSLTYVDDSFGRSSTVSASGDMQDFHTIIEHLLGPGAYNVTKTEGPLPALTIIGWLSDVSNYTIQPSTKGQCKLYYWIFRGLRRDKSIPLPDLQSAIGTLRWYSLVIPLASTHALQRVLSQRQHQLALTPSPSPFCRLTAAAGRELDWWQWILSTNLRHPMLQLPVWYLARDRGDRPCFDLYTDASSEIGAGYYIPHHSYGQFRWSDDEKLLFGTTGSTDINALEFVTAICALVANRELFRGAMVRIHVDNTSAVSWLNKLRTSQDSGQSWMRLLISVLLDQDILIDCLHIPGVENIHADALSRYLQDQESTRNLTQCLQNVPMMSTPARHVFWRMSSMWHSPKEYLSTLERLAS